MKNGKTLYKQIRYYKEGKKNFYSEKFVDGKWEKGLKDVERVLYKLPQIIEGIKEGKTIYIVEGEKDVETLLKKGKLATTIVGGAKQKWLDSYTQYLKNGTIVIIPDNDEVGQEFAKKIANSLANEVKSVKILNLTKKWKDLKEKGDITDVFEMINNDDIVLKEMKDLEEKTSLFIKPKKVNKDELGINFFEELGIKIFISCKYSISKSQGIIKKDDKKERKIFPIPIVITKILKNINTGEEMVELAFLKRKRWKRIIVDKNTICTRQNILTLANKGVPVCDKNGNDLVEYLFDFEMDNLNNKEFKVEQTTNKMGWVDNYTFVPYRSNEVSLKLKEGIKTWLNKINQKRGSIEEWKTNIKEFLNQDETGLIRFFVAIGFSSCLLRIVKFRGTIFHLWGNSGIGKTGLLELVNSIYAGPENIITFAATPISITILSEALSGIGLIIDEKQSSFNDSQISMLLYSLAEGRVRMKATKESDLIDNKTFELNVITSGEEPLSENFHTGASRRTIELYAKKIFKDNKSSVKAHNISKEVYGLAGELFVNYLIDNYSKNDYLNIKELYNEIQEKLVKELDDNVVYTYIQSISVILIADILMNKIFEFGFDENSSIELGKSILLQLNKEKEIDEIEKGKEIFENFLSSNDGKIERQKFRCVNNSVEFDENKKKVEIRQKEESLDCKDRYGQVYGMYDDGIYYIYPLIFNKLMKENNLSPNKIRRGFAERGYILVDQVNNRYTVNKFYNGKNQRMVAYKMENKKVRKVEELKKFGVEIEKIDEIEFVRKVFKDDILNDSDFKFGVKEGKIYKMNIDHFYDLLEVYNLTFGITIDYLTKINYIVPLKLNSHEKDFNSIDFYLDKIV